MNETTVWVRGRPVRGFFFGLLFGLGLFLLMTKFDVIPIDLPTLVVGAAAGGVAGAIRGLIGRPYRVSFEEAPKASAQGGTPAGEAPPE